MAKKFYLIGSSGNTNRESISVPADTGVRSAHSRTVEYKLSALYYSNIPVNAGVVNVGRNCTKRII